MEPCGAHGGALCKNRSIEGKDIGKALNSFSRFTRFGKNMDDLHSATDNCVTADTIELCCGELPDENERWVKSIVEVLFTDGGKTKCLWRTTKRKGRVHSQYSHQLHQFLGIINISVAKRLCSGGERRPADKPFVFYVPPRDWNGGAPEQDTIDWALAC